MTMHIREDEETERLIQVVEYLEPLMAKELLCKFPDNSTFDFDYSQSSIWSPLLPHPHSPMNIDLKYATPLRLSFDLGMEPEKKNRGRKIPSAIKKKVVSNFLGINRNVLNSSGKKKKKKMMMTADFSPSPIKAACFPISTKVFLQLLLRETNKPGRLCSKKIQSSSSRLEKNGGKSAILTQSSPLFQGWAKVLKAAGKQFKKKRDLTAQLKFTS